MGLRGVAVLALLLTATATGCAIAEDDGDDASAESGDDALTGAPKEGTADATMLVAYVNDATTSVDVLVGIGVTKKTATGLVARRDARHFTTVADVMSVSGVGASTVAKLLTAARAHAGAPAAQDLVLTGCGGGTMNIRLAQGNGEAVAMFRAPRAPELDIAVGFDDTGKAHAYYSSWDTQDGYQVDLTLADVVHDQARSGPRSRAAAHGPGGTRHDARRVLPRHDARRAPLARRLRRAADLVARCRRTPRDGRQVPRHAQGHVRHGHGQHARRRR